MTAQPAAADRQIPAADRRGGEALLAAISRRIGKVLGSVAELGDAMTALAASAAGQRPLRRPDLASLRPLAATVLRRHQGLVAGAGVVLAPTVLADAARWIEWCWAGPNGAISRLDVDLDPGSAEFYDYTTTEWYREPARTGRRWVAGPYVDYICTHQYTFTLSAPLTLGDRFLGVAGADILADRVERLVLPGLARLGAGTVLVSGHGRVIAASSASILPGTVLARHAGAAGLRPVAGPPAGDGDGQPAVPWLLLRAASASGSP
ncbi:MAG TPA: cache domain-containing protein [Streptosporangiaceae bacterium]